MNMYEVASLIATIVCIFVAGFVYLKGRTNPLYFSFSTVTLLAGIWTAFPFLISTLQEEKTILFSGRLIYAFAVFVPASFLYFVSYLLEDTIAKIDRSYLKATLFFSFLFAFVVFHPSFIQGIKFKIPFYGIEPGWLYYLFSLFFASTCVYTFYRFYQGYLVVSGSKKTQFGYIMLAFGSAYTGGFLHLVANYFGVEPIPHDLFLIAFPTLISYAIIRHRLMEIRTAIHKTAMWLALSSTIALPVAILIFFSHSWLKDLTAPQLSFFAAALVLLLIPYGRFIQPRVDHLFQRRQYNMQKILQGMVRELAALKNLDGLIGKIASTIQEALYVSKVTLFLWKDKEQQFKAVEGKGMWGEKEEPITADHPFLSWMKEQDRVIEWDEIEMDPKHESIRSFAMSYFKKIDAKIALPLIHDGKLIGLINLGDKNNLKPFSEMDVEFLSTLRAEASISLSNSLLYDDVSKMSEEVRQWASELERKVEERTRELAESKRQIEDAYQKLQELDQIKTKFFANISHELRTPITLILAPTEMMLNRNLGNLTKDQEKYLTIMQTNSLRLLKLINNLLDLAKIDAGKMELYYNRADFAKYVNGVVFSVSPMAEKKSLALRFTSNEAIPEFFFDADKIEKVILNLVFNALKFTERGEITVSCSRQENNVLVKVSDTGIGIPKEHMPKLFSRFSQADSSASRKYEGTGIGLALARELVELHHGKIWAESEEGRGTTFFFTIPIYTRLEDVPGALDRRTEIVPVPERRREEDWTKSLETQADYATAGIVKEAAPFPEETGGTDGRHRILLVEDNPNMLSYIASQLKDDYQLLFAKEGREGVDRAKSDIPDLIISDVMMPYKDGYQLCREIKEEPRTCHIPIILLTAKTGLSTKIEGLEQGADDYLTKPFNSQELRARVRSLLNLRKLEREIQLRSHQLEETLRELKETQSQLVQSERMAALGLLVAGVAHEINNPVSFAKGSLAIIRRSLEEIKNASRLTPAEVTELFEDIETSANVVKNGLDRTENIIKSLKSFVRKDEEVFKTFDLHEGFESTLQLLRHELAHRITIHRDYGKIPLIEGIPGQINQVFLNILQNAVQSIADQGEIFIKTEQIGEQIQISIRDTGCGISEESLPHIFDPFFTTKEAGKGTGLGMTITYRIVEGHHGRIEVKSKVGSGTEVIVLLPVSQPTDFKKKAGRGLYAGSAPI